MSDKQKGPQDAKGGKAAGAQDSKGRGDSKGKGESRPRLWSGRRFRALLEHPWLAVIGVSGPGVMLIVVGFAATYSLAEPPLPDKVVLAAGPEDGEAFAFAQRYAEVFDSEGVQLEVRVTSGSLENLQLLEERPADVMAALVLAGTAPESRRGKQRSLGAAYLQPLWVFHRGLSPITHLATLRGARVGVGPEGSDTNAIASQLLAESGVLYTPPTLAASEQPTRLLPLDGVTAANALRNGELDAMLMISTAQSPLVLNLLKVPGIQVMQFSRQAAYHRRYPFMQGVTLPQGTLDVPDDLPNRDVALVAPAVNLLARDELHPGLVPLFIRALRDVHGSGDILSEAGTFPNTRLREFPMHPQAEQLFTSGSTFLHRMLPYQQAASIERLRLMILPFMVLVIPALWVLPFLWRWRLHARIYRWYGVLRTIELQMAGNADKALLEKEKNTLEAVEQELAEVRVPLSYMREYYTLRQHIRLLKGELDARLAGEGEKRR